MDSNLPSGVYTIYPDAAMTPMVVVCDNIYDGGGWTVRKMFVKFSCSFWSILQKESIG